MTWSAVLGTLAFSGYWVFAKSARQRIPTLEFMAGVWLSRRDRNHSRRAGRARVVRGEPGEWPWIVALAVVPGVGHVLMNWGHRFVDASVSAVIGILNAPVAAVAALIILGQALSLLQILCGVVAVTAIALVAKGRPRTAAEAIDPVGLAD